MINDAAKSKNGATLRSATPVASFRRDVLLGLSRHEPHTETAFLPVDGTALLFTDGLVEDRRVLIDDNLEKLRTAALKAADADVEAFANHVMALFGSSEDDLALIVLRRTG